MTAADEFNDLAGQFRSELLAHCRETVTRFLSILFTEAGRFRMIPVTANGQSAFAAYQHEPVGPCRAHAVVVPALTGSQIARNVIFLDPAVFGLFKLPVEQGGPMPAPVGH